MRALVDGKIQSPPIALAERVHRAEQTLKFVVDVFVRAQFDREAPDVIERGV